MGLNDSLLLLAVALFGCTYWALHREDRRASDRRKTSRPVPVERRVGDRRRGGLGATLSWLTQRFLGRR